MRENVQQWAAMQTPPKLKAHQFSLVLLAPVVRVELLHALQQRDVQGHKLDPVAVKALVQAATGADSLANVPRRGKLADLVAAKGAAGAYARMLTRIIGLRFEEFRGIVHTDKDVWDCLALDLEAPRAGRRTNLARIDFTPIGQRWLRDAAKEWVRTVRPDSTKLQRTLLACTLASQALAQRPGGGHDMAVLTFADMTVVFEEIKHAKQSSGQLYNSHFRRGLWAMFHQLIEFGRSTGTLAELPGSFHRSSTQSIREDETNEDEIGKAIPEPVITQLDAHLPALGTRHSHGWNWSAIDTAALFQTAYQVLRDTGRRPGELVSLHADCLELDQGEWALVYDNHKKQRLRRRLPITTNTATTIQQWQQHRALIDLPTTGRDWLFPAAPSPFGTGHLSANRFAMVLREWVDAIPTLHSDLPGPDGTPLPFDRTLIYPYAFRHSYAQRHADAGVGVEVLKELMDHRDITVTQGYYKVSLTRKRDAIKIMSRYVHDRTGTLVHTSGSSSRYELRSVAVPFGNCLEPSNVKAGGKQCPIRFQCAGCGFYRPDPSYLPAIEDHINALKADRETAAAMDADTFVIRNLTDQADAFTDVATAMRDKLATLTETERIEVEQASATLRKLRAGRINLPLTVKINPDNTDTPVNPDALSAQDGS